MHIMCVANKCEAEALHIVSTSKKDAGYGTCSLHLRSVLNVVTGYYGGRISVSLVMPIRRDVSMEVVALTSRRQHRLAG
jgi:hypothetical protein